MMMDDDDVFNLFITLAKYHQQAIMGYGWPTKTLPSAQSAPEFEETNTPTPGANVRISSSC